MEKINSRAFGKKVYLLGNDMDGIKYWLEAPVWDCDWYWGFGYIETYTNNNNPSISKDINCHQHAMNFMDWCIEWNGKKPILTNTVFNEKEAWKLCELFKRFYMFQDMAQYYYRGGAGVTSIGDDKKNLAEWKRINDLEIPYITNEIISILSPK